MPHGSGGGSHGGSSHHSSHHSSHGGSHSGGGGGFRGPRISRRPFPRSRRYRYYTRRGAARYIYCDTLPTPMSPGALIASLIPAIPFALAGLILIAMILCAFFPLFPLSQDYYDDGVYIEDQIEILGDTNELQANLQSFKSRTGIAPYIITVHDEDWNGKYCDLETYAYALYVNRFADEKHFVVVYSEPYNAAELDWVDWSWEGMQGDDTDPIITTEHFRQFQNDLQRNLTNESVSVNQAFVLTFANTSNYMMSASPDWNAVLGLIIFAAIWNLFIWGLLIIPIIKFYINSNHKYEEISDFSTIPAICYNNGTYTGYNNNPNNSTYTGYNNPNNGTYTDNNSNPNDTPTDGSDPYDMGSF